MPKRNPFAPNQVVKDTTAVPTGHVPELHKPTLDVIHRLIATAQATGQPTSLLAVGESGSGKTHLIAQLRHELRADPGVLVVPVMMDGAHLGGIWRHIRRELVRELLHETESQPGGLRRLLVARYPQWGQVRAINGIFDIIFPPSAPRLEQLTSKDADLSPELRKVLPKVFESATQLAASDWLKGESLADDALQSLGVVPVDRTDREQEAAARGVVRSLCRLAGKSPTLVVVFDNLERVQATTTDADALREYAWAAGELATDPGPRVVATFIRPDTAALLLKSDDRSAKQRITANRTELPPLDRWEYVERLVGAAFESSPEWIAARRMNADVYWPLGEPFLRTLLNKNRFSLTPRHLLGACRTELDRLLSGKPLLAKPAPAKAQAATPSATESPPPPPVVRFDTPWTKKRDKSLAQPSAVAFDTLVNIGFPWLQETFGAGWERVGESFEELPDVGLLFRRAGQPLLLGVSACNHPPTPFFRRIDRLRKQWHAGRQRHLAALVLVRRDGEKWTDAGKKRWADAAADGMKTVALAPQQFAELAAYQELFGLTQNGTFLYEGRPVSVAEYQTWAGEHLSSAVTELADSLFGPREAVPLVAEKTARKSAAKTKAKI